MIETLTLTMANKAKTLFGINAVSAWLGFGGSVIVNTFDLVPEGKIDPHLFGPHTPGMGGALSIKGVMFFSLFLSVIWSIESLCSTEVFLKGVRSAAFKNISDFQVSA